MYFLNYLESDAENVSLLNLKNVSVKSNHHDNYILLCICKLSLFSSLLPKGYIILDLGPFKE